MRRLRAEILRAKWFYSFGERRLSLHENTESEIKIPDVLVISPGGVATTFLIKHLMNYVETNCPYDTDELKHLPQLPNFIDDETKIIFVYGRNEDIYQSIKRRDWVEIQGAKLGCSLCGFFRGRIQKWLFIKLVERQKSLFLNDKRKNMLILNYDEIWERKADIKSFLEIDDVNFINNFPARTARMTQH